ncbi:MAG: peptidase MA family metallohydrolase [Planctomycetota bacterium]
MNGLLGVVLAALPVLPGAPFFLSPSQAQVTWKARPGLEDRARELAGEVEALLGEARAFTRLAPDPRPVALELVGSREELSRRLGGPVPEWVAAVTLPARRRMILALSSASSPERLRTTLRHEVMHLALADLGPQAAARLPAWFHEGVCEQFAGDVYLGGVGVALSWRAWSGRLEGLSAYRKSFGNERLHAAAGYALARSFVARLVRLYGPEILPNLLERVAGGASLDNALLAETGLSVVTQEEGLHQELRSLGGLLRDFYPQVFLGLMLLLMIGFPFFWRARRRKRLRFEARWDRSAAAEAAAAAAAGWPAGFDEVDEVDGDPGPPDDGAATPE